jgi:hypothetical protein
MTRVHPVVRIEPEDHGAPAFDFADDGDRPEAAGEVLAQGQNTCVGT